MPHTYRNTTDRELVIPNHGVVVAGGTITSEVPIENPNLEPADATPAPLNQTPTPSPIVAPQAPSNPPTE